MLTVTPHEYLIHENRCSLATGGFCSDKNSMRMCDVKCEPKDSNLHRNRHKTQNKPSLLQVYSSVITLYAFFFFMQTTYWRRCFSVF